MKKKIIITIVVVGLLTGLFGILEKLNITDIIHSGTDTTDTSLTAEQKQAAKLDADNKKNLIDTTKPGSTTNNNSGTANSTPSLDLSARSESNGTVTVFTKLYNISNGVCELTATNGSTQKSLSANVIYQPEYSSCAGFSLPINDLGVGTWTIALTVKSNGHSYAKNINYEVK
jgi:hypothetical protein